jgi:hypothetical protein
MEQCARCGKESSELRVYRTWGGTKARRREHICGACHDEATDPTNFGLTAEEIRHDNARWERIFSEKFADQTYYAIRAPAVQSSFGALAFQLETLCGEFMARRT